MPIGIFKTRGPVYRLDRSRKARMIEAFLCDGLGGAVSGRRILDVGCGNGMISSYFSLQNEVTGVDIEDLRRQDAIGYEFIQVGSASMPFEDSSFDIVLSHHVIEHIPDQKMHLQEIGRVMKPDGLAYLGTPNKSSPIMEGHVGNEMVLRYRQMEALFRGNGFEPELLSHRLVADPVHYHGDIHFGRYLPKFILKTLVPLFPSHYFLLRKSK